MLKTTRSLDLPQKDDNDEVVGGGDNRNLSKSKSKKSKNVMSGVQTHLDATSKPIFLTLDAKEDLTNWDKRLPKLRSSDTLIQNIISGLRLMFQAMS